MMEFFHSFTFQVLLRSVLAVLIGSLIGSERSRHGRAAGTRTHILVCLGACMTSMTSLFVYGSGVTGDVFRISAQVISGVGFLGAGVIILKNNSTVTGITTAAGVWATGAIGVALGYGFYIGALIVTALFLITIILFARFERRKTRTEVLYIEIDDMYRTNAVLAEFDGVVETEFTSQILPPRSGKQGNLGIIIMFERSVSFDISALRGLESVVYITKE